MYLINYEKVSPNISRKVKIKFWQFLKSDTKLFVQRKLHLQGGALWPELTPCPSYSNIYLSELGANIPAIIRHWVRTMARHRHQTGHISADHGIRLINNVLIINTVLHTELCQKEGPWDLVTLCPLSDLMIQLLTEALVIGALLPDC